MTTSLAAGRGSLGLLTVALLALVPGTTLYAQTALTTNTRADLAHSRPSTSVSMRFVPNRGQSDTKVLFAARGRDYSVNLTAEEAVLAWQDTSLPDRPVLSAPFGARRVEGSVLRLKPVGTRRPTVVEGEDPLRTKVHSYIGNDPAKWRTDLPTYRAVRYREVYRGVDLLFYGSDRELEYDFVVAPGVDPGIITLELGGADRVRLDATGDLVMQVGERRIVQRKPFIYQEVGGERREIAGRWRVKGRGRVGFEVGAYDRSTPLVIDPVFVYSTYLGGSDFESVSEIAADSWGNAYVTGYTVSDDFPAGNVKPDLGNWDAFVAQLDPYGQPMYITYLGGRGGGDFGRGIAVGAYNGLAYVVGETDSTRFPTTPGVFQPVDPDAQYYNGMLISNGSDAFVTVLAPGGTVISSTYLGDSGQGYFHTDGAYGVAVDAWGLVYVAGLTQSDFFPTTANAFQSSRAGFENVFATVLDPWLSSLFYSTYFGDVREDTPHIAVDPLGFNFEFAIAGTVYLPTGLPTTAGAVQPVAGGGSFDGFVAKFNALGGLIYSTFLGGSEGESLMDVKIDASGNVHVTGGTESRDFPTTPGAFQSRNTGRFSDAFMTKLDPAGAAFAYSTYLGGGDHDFATGIDIDPYGNAYITGITYSTYFPVMAPVQPTHGWDWEDAFVTKLNASGQMVFSTFLGGSNLDETWGAIAVDADENVYVAGFTYSSDFPVRAAFQPTNHGWADGFVTKLNTRDVQADLAVDISVAPNQLAMGDTATYTITVTNNGPAIATSVVLTFTSFGGQNLNSPVTTNGWCSTMQSCTLAWLGAGASWTITIDAFANASGPISVTADVTATEEDGAIMNNHATANANVM